MCIHIYIYTPTSPNYALRDPKYHLIETIRPLIEVHWGAVGTYACSCVCGIDRSSPANRGQGSLRLMPAGPSFVISEALRCILREARRAQPSSARTYLPKGSKYTYMSTYMYIYIYIYIYIFLICTCVLNKYFIWGLKYVDHSYFGA